MDDETAGVIAGIDIIVAKKRDSDGNIVPGYTKKIRLWDKNSALEKLGKRFKLWDDKVKINATLKMVTNVEPE